MDLHLVRLQEIPARPQSIAVSLQVGWPVVLQVGQGDDGCRGAQGSWRGVVRGADLWEREAEKTKY